MGSHSPSRSATLTHAFPRPSTLAEMDPADLAMPASRKRALLTLCAAIADGTVVIDPGVDRRDLVERLVALPGIGPWTAGYIAMRALGDPDVFLPTDLGVRHAVERLGADGSRGRSLHSPSVGVRGARTHCTTSGPASREGDPHMTLARTTIDSPVGELTLVASAAGLRAVLWLEHEESRVNLGDDEIVDDDEHPVLRSAAAQLAEYFAGDRTTFDLPLDPVGTPFQQKSWDVLRTIPFGTTISVRRAGDATRRAERGARRRRGERAQPDLDRRAVPPRDRQRRLADRLRGRAGNEGLAARAREPRELAPGPRPDAADVTNG